MKLSAKVLARTLLVLLLAGSLTAIGVNQHTITQLQDERSSLLNETQEARQLMEENRELPHLREAKSEADALREENKDLPRLRNVARQLRRETEAMEKLRAENQRFLANPKITAAPAAVEELPADFQARTTLVDVGFATPEAALQTTLMAMCQGNITRMKDAFLDSLPIPNEITEAQRQALIAKTIDVKGFRIAEKRELSPDEVELGVQTKPQGQITHIKVKLVRGEWKMESF